MRTMRAVVGLAICLTTMLPLASSARSQTAPKSKSGSDDAPVGDWRGDSTCQVKPSACHDEDSLYHFSRLEKKPGWLSLKADKIVDGVPVTMGTMECSYDREKHSLECSLPKAVLQFEVRGNLMQGTMKLLDGTLWRKLSLKKVE
jgi:hypothetical protein